MKRSIFLLFVIGVISLYSEKVFSAEDDYEYRLLLDDPNKTWVGKTIKVSFDYRGGKSIRNKTKILELVSFEKDSDGLEYFKVKDISDGYLQELYFFWFHNSKNKNGVGPNITFFEEAIKSN